MERDCEQRNAQEWGVRFAIGTGEHEPLNAGEHAGKIQNEELAQIVHDLKNPLSSIAIEAELLDARIGRGDQFDASRSVGRILQNVMFLDRLIYDLMDACTMANGQFALRRTACDLRALLHAAIERVV